MGAGTPSGSDSEANASPSGIVQGHAYSILDVQEADEFKLIQLRNPWGRKEWTGDFSDKSDKWTRRLKGLINYKDVDDGAFWMEFQDFTIHFEDIYICRFFDPPQWQPMTCTDPSALTVRAALNSHASCILSHMYQLDTRVLLYLIG